MKKKWILLLAPPAIVLFIWLGGELVMRLWNWLAPALFGWRLVTFWQALGLLLLCRILFGRLGCGSQRSHGQRRLADRWEKLKPEERERFRQSVCARTPGFSSPTGGTQEPAS